jgi:hypothetical protein
VPLKAPAEHRSASLLRKLRRAEHYHRQRLQIAVEHAPLGRRTARAELDVHQADRVGLLLDGTRVGDRQVGPLEQLAYLRAVSEARDAEALQEDRVGADGRSCRGGLSKPRIIAVMPTIDVMPMTTPSTVSAERILLVRIVSNAIATTSQTGRCGSP